MPDKIDRLEVQVQAQATAANNALDKMAVNLEKISVALNGINASGLVNLSNGVQSLGNAMQAVQNVKATDFNRLVKGISKLGSIDATSLNSAATALSQITRAFSSLSAVSGNAADVAELAKGISKLGNKSVTNAAANMPALALALKDLMTTLSTAPRVSKNLIQMTNALASLSSTGAKVGSASRSLGRSLKTYSGHAVTASRRTKGLVSQIGMFYARCFLLIRAVKALGSAFEKAMDYIETFNYFSKAFGAVGQDAAAQWEEAGYESAEAYVNSFTERALQLTEKMTGFSVDASSGEMVSTGAPSLGMDPAALMNYQATFAQMSNSMGVAAETSAVLSDALTMIGADLASIKNMKFEDVWSDMASGLAGMSRTLDKYGINIRNVNLEQVAMEIGYNKYVEAMNQNEKAMLRTIVILKSSQYAWGDLAETINQPANQLRLLGNNFANLARTIGGLFMPVITAVLPYVNALVMAVQRLVAWIGTLLGVKWSSASGAIGSSSVDMSDFADSADSAASSLGGAASSAKELKKTILGFDQLNVLADPNSGSGGGGGGVAGGLGDMVALQNALNAAMSEYQAKWDEALSNIEDKSTKLANIIDKAFEPIREIIQDFAVGDFFEAGKDVSHLAASITQFFANAIDSIDWYGIGQAIGDFLAGIDWTAVLGAVGDLIWEAVNAALEFGAGLFDAAPLEMGIVAAIAALKWTGLRKILLETIGPKLKEAIGLAIGGAGNLFEAMTVTIGPLATYLLGIGSAIGGVIVWAKSFFDMWNEGFSWASEALMLFGVALGAVGALILGAPALVTGVIAGIVAVVSTAAILIKNNWDSICAWFDQSIKEVGEFYNALGKSIVQYFSNAWANTQEKWANTKEWFGNNVIQPLISFFFNLGENISQKLSDAKESFIEAWYNIPNWFNTNVVQPVLSIFSNLWSTVQRVTQGAWDFIVGIFNKGGKIFDGVVDGVASTFKSIVNAIIRGINKVIAAPFRTVNSVLNKIRSISILGLQPFKALWGYSPLPVPQIPTFATGGFPEDGLFMANHGELVGQFSNGKTAVANNEQITQGIAQAVFPAVYNAVRSAMSESNNGGNQMIDNRIYIGEEEVARAVTRGQQKLNRRYQLSTT